MKLPVWAVSGLVLIAVGGWAHSCIAPRDDEAQRAAEDSLAQAKERLADRERAIKNLSEAMRQVDSTSRADSAETVVIVREAEIQVDTALATARAAADTVRIVLEEVYPDVLDTFDRLLGGFGSALAAKDTIIGRAEQRESQLLARIRIRDTALDTLAAALEDSKVATRHAEEALRLAKRRDVNLFGLRLDVACGPTVAAGVGTRGPDVLVGIGCSVGR